jgi:hypothetical protein
MMVFSQIDESLYEEAQVQIGYCKLFPHMVKDFITRKDAAKMMEPSNLPFTSTVTVGPGQVVATTGTSAAQAGSTTTPGSGKGIGQVSPIYNGSFKIPADEILAKEKEVIKNAGGRATKAVLDTALGG